MSGTAAVVRAEPILMKTMDTWNWKELSERLGKENGKLNILKEEVKKAKADYERKMDKRLPLSVRRKIKLLSKAELQELGKRYKILESNVNMLFRENNLRAWGRRQYQESLR